MRNQQGNHSRQGREQSLGQLRHFVTEWPWASYFTSMILVSSARIRWEREVKVSIMIKEKWEFSREAPATVHYTQHSKGLSPINCSCHVVMAVHGQGMLILIEGIFLPSRPHWAASTLLLKDWHWRKWPEFSGQDGVYTVSKACFQSGSLKEMTKKLTLSFTD